MAVTPVTARQTLLAAAALAEAEQADSLHPLITFKLRRRLQPVGLVPGAGVAKLVQFDVLVPPDNAVNIAKFVQYDVVLPPDNAAHVAKLVQVPREGPGRPRIDGVVLPVISSANWAYLTDAWLRNAHRAGGRAA